VYAQLAYTGSVAETKSRRVHLHVVAGDDELFRRASLGVATAARERGVAGASTSIYDALAKRRTEAVEDPAKDRHAR